MLDPAIAYTLGAMGVGIAGIAVGIFAGGGLWSVVRGSAQTAMKQRERDFFSRIKANRAVPSSQAVSNAAPDFYGEKIKSVKDYRKWLRSQRKVSLRLLPQNRNRS
jgi:import inner membrane translocase subunit TIM23